MHILINSYIHKNGKNENKEENLRVSLVRDTYHQISNQYCNSQNSRYTIKAFENFENIIEKSA